MYNVGDTVKFHDGTEKVIYGRRINEYMHEGTYVHYQFKIYPRVVSDWFEHRIVEGWQK